MEILLRKHEDFREIGVFRGFGGLYPCFLGFRGFPGFSRVFRGFPGFSWFYMVFLKGLVKERKGEKREEKKGEKRGGFSRLEDSGPP